MSTSAAEERDAASPSPMPDLVAVLAQFIARPGREARIRDGLLRMVEAGRGESGNLGYDLHQLDEKPWAFYAFANWSDRAAMEAHADGAPVREFVAEHAAEDLAAKPTRSCARMLSHPDPDAGRPRPVPHSDQVTFFPFFSVKPGQLPPVRDALLGAVDPTRSEEGCLEYDLYQSFDDPAALFYREDWAAQSMLDKHMNTPGFHRIVRGEIDPRLSVPWSGLSMRMISEPGAVLTA